MVQKFKTLSDAIALAEFAHRNQVDKAGLPYIEHPKRVLERVKAQGGLPYVQIGAVLHDVTEDTAFTIGMLSDLGFSPAAVEIVKLVDRGYSRLKFSEQWHAKVPDNYWPVGEFKYPGQNAENDFYYEEIKKNRGALMVKLSDIADNMEPWRRHYLPVDEQKRLAGKYQKALDILNPVPQNHGLIIDSAPPFNQYLVGGY